MKALVYTAPQQIELQDVPMPEDHGDEVLVKVEYVGICGSDMHAYLGHDERRPAPLILGHEATGTIIDGDHKGQRVVVNPLVTCGKCGYCQHGQENLCQDRVIISIMPRQGAFAEYIRLPQENLIPIPDHFPSSKAALCEPMACGWNAAKKTKHFLQDKFSSSRALVLGGGAVGVGSALSLKAMGHNDVTVVEANMAKKQFLIDQIGLSVMTPDAFDKLYLDDNMGFDLVIDAVGIEATRKTASKAVRAGGIISHIGLGSATAGLDIRRMTLQEITFMGVYTYSPEDFRETANAIFSNQLGSLDWAEIHPLEEGAEAFAAILSGGMKSPKILLQPDSKGV